MHEITWRIHANELGVWVEGAVSGYMMRQVMDMEVLDRIRYPENAFFFLMEIITIELERVTGLRLA